MHNYLVDRIKETHRRREQSLQRVPPYYQDLDARS